MIISTCVSGMETRTCDVRTTRNRFVTYVIRGTVNVPDSVALTISYSYSFADRLASDLRFPTSGEQRVHGAEYRSIRTQTRSGVLFTSSGLVGVSCPISTARRIQPAPFAGNYILVTEIYTYISHIRHLYYHPVRFQPWVINERHERLKEALQTYIDDPSMACVPVVYTLS